jgi:hypothetical protein
MKDDPCQNDAVHFFIKEFDDDRPPHYNYRCRYSKEEYMIFQIMKSVYLGFGTASKGSAYLYSTRCKRHKVHDLAGLQIFTLNEYIVMQIMES